MFPRGRAVGIKTHVFPLSLALYSLYFSIPIFLSYIYIFLIYIFASPSLSVFLSLPLSSSLLFSQSLSPSVFLFKYIPICDRVQEDRNRNRPSLEVYILIRSGGVLQSYFLPQTAHNTSKSSNKDSQDQGCPILFLESYCLALLFIPTLTQHIGFY